MPAAHDEQLLQFAPGDMFCLPGGSESTHQQVALHERHHRRLKDSKAGRDPPGGGRGNRGVRSSSHGLQGIPGAGYEGQQGICCL